MAPDFLGRRDPRTRSQHRGDPRHVREQIGAAGGRLYVSGLDPDMAVLLARTVPVTVQRPDRVFGVTPVLGESTWAALHEAHAWGVEPHH
jgi:hypothetical protein